MIAASAEPLQAPRKKRRTAPSAATPRQTGAALDRLAPWPAVRRLLERRGVSCACAASETGEAFENRLGTGLMVLFRDTRRPECFEALYAFTGPSVLQWIRGLLHRGLTHLDPAELVQDTFINVYRYPSGFREDHAGSFRVWVRTIAGNIVRRSSTTRRRDFYQEMPEGNQEPADRRENPADRAVIEEQEVRLRSAYSLFLMHYAKAWEQLSQRDRRTLHLVEVEGLSYGEAGRILEVGRSNMKMIVFRARKRLAQRMRIAMNACLFESKARSSRRAG